MAADESLSTWLRENSIIDEGGVRYETMCNCSISIGLFRGVGT